MRDRAAIDRLREATARILEDSSRDGTIADPGPEWGEDERGAFERSIRLLGVRARSRHELRGRLLEREVPEVSVERVLDRLVALRLLDDADFAEEWVRSRHRVSGRGRRILRRELRDKGIAPDVADRALDQIGPADERAAGEALIARRMAAVDPADLSERVSRDRVMRRLVGMLARRGLSAELSLAIVRDAVNTRRAEC